MSDLRTELFTKVVPKMQSLSNLNFDDPEQPLVPPLEHVTNNELIFEYVKEHPACYGKDVVAAMAGKVSSDSVMSQLFALTSRKLLHKTPCSSTGLLIYSAAVDKYPRSNMAYRVKKMHEARSKMTPEEISRRISEGHKRNKLAEAEKQLEPVQQVAVQKPEPKAKAKSKPAPVSTPAVQVTPVDLNTLSIVQARKLYDELKQIFGA